VHKTILFLVCVVLPVWVFAYPEQQPAPDDSLITEETDTVPLSPENSDTLIRTEGNGHSKDTLPLFDSLSLTEDSTSLDSPQDTTIENKKRSKDKRVLSITTGCSWDILQSQEISRWQRALGARVDSVYDPQIERPFDNFINTFAPALGASFQLLNGITIGVDLQYFRYSKYLVYRVKDDSLHIRSYSEELLFMGTPAQLWFTVPVPESLFSVQGFEKFFWGAGAFILPWTKIEAHGNLQPLQWGKGKSLGYLIKIGIQKTIAPWCDYSGEISYARAKISTFKQENKNLTNAQLFLPSENDFSMEYGRLHFLLKFLVHKPDPERAPKRPVRSGYSGS
jgi:hypothetical protein